MKIKNIFKKLTKAVANTNIQKMDKTQLEKIVGGVDELPTSPSESASRYRVNTATGEISVNK